MVIGCVCVCDVGIDVIVNYGLNANSPREPYITM